ncbi:YczE/YyaS/YitT family protein [Jeotgalibacillus proteolyticus]|uniref:Membrane protein n=1 Tax=Jeotgalibacillus proteolyticus TaxID=2082395 RepID=A0A2S5GCZ7_9BACL|nr:membrane protein [Jeotgalibacillus proteolyticus]PPA70880.1 membrane protein [Jeotgalibacillus proteolyticus]
MKKNVTLGLFYLIGLFILSFGISLMIIADLGAGPWDAFYVALADLVGLTVGTWIFIIGILLIVINGVLMKKRPDFLAAITIIIMSFLIDFWLLIAFGDFLISGVLARSLMLGGGILSIAAGVSLYLQANFAQNPIDGLMIAVHTRTGLSLSRSKTVLEVGILIVALVIGGPIGVGTVIVALGIGPLIQLFFGPASKMKSRMILPAAPMPK